MARKLTPERRAALMAYCRIDELTPEETPVLEMIVQAAEAYMMQAGVSEPEEGTSRRGQYDLCINAMVLDGWDRRGIAASERGTFTTVENRSFRQILNQLKMTEPVSKLDT